MKRFHIHIGVKDLEKSIQFYNRLFNQPPSISKGDYAKWQLDDPTLNFAISTRSQQKGVDHLGIEIDSDAALQQMKTQMDANQLNSESQLGTTCCYAESDKHWTMDPQGMPWEIFHKLGEAPVFKNEEQTCCTSSHCC